MMEDEVRILLDKICAQKRRNYSESLRPYNLHVGQEHALFQLWREEGITQLELSKRMGCEPPTVTNMIKKLEEYGFVYRRRDSEDGRVSRVYLTPEGQALQEPVQEVWRTQQEKMLANISPEERLVLHRLMQQMYENMS